MRRIAILCLSLFVCLPVGAERIGIQHLGKVVGVSSPEMAPDGRSVVIVVSRVNYAENRHEPQLVLVDVATGAQRVLTDRRGLSSPRFSASGARLGFLANVDGKPQLFVLPMAGGESTQVTQSPTGVQQFAWSPDEKEIAFVAADEPVVKAGEERFNDSFEVENDDYLVTAAPISSHLWLIKGEGGVARRLTSGSWSLPVTKPPGSPSSPIVWSPDGKQIVIAKVVSPHSGDNTLRTLQLVDVATGAMRSVTNHTKSEGYPTFSPDGKQIAYWYPRDDQGKLGNDIHVVPTAGGESVDVTRALDRNMARSIWLDDKTLLVGANHNTTTGLWIQPISGAARRIELGKIVPASAFWVDMSVSKTGAIAFAGSEPLHGSELYVLASAQASPKRLTDFNKETAALELGRTETVEWDGPDGFRNDGVVTYPPDFSAGRKYPLVLYVHGGPRASSKEAFSARVQIFAAQGWVVFEPNYRGSDNRGNAFQAAIWNDAGAGPGRDVMSGVELLKKRGFVDESRMAVSGWSYGGYMTTWLLGHYPTAWKAAVAGASVTDWIDQYDMNDGNVRVGNSFGGSPWKDGRDAAFREQSPITNAPKITAPTLVMHNTGDFRVTITQSYKLFHALKDNGVPTKFVAYPIYGHNAGDPVRQRDVTRRWVAWLAEHLGPAEAAATGSRP